MKKKKDYISQSVSLYRYNFTELLFSTLSFNSFLNILKTALKKVRGIATNVTLVACLAYHVTEIG